MKVLTVVGARPQFIKAAAVSRAFADHGAIQEIIVHTGQHFADNMSEIFFREMDIPTPNYRLDVHSLTHAAMTGRMMEQIEDVLMRERPRFVLVYGDTNSTLAGALAAKKLGLGVVHVEAGLRSFNMAMPEEVNRVLTDRISDILYCPTEAAIRNLKQEGFEHFDCRIVQCGDVMQDAALFYARRAEEKSRILDELDLNDKRYLLCTLHRAENTDDAARLGQIVAGLNELAARMPVILPLHPRTRQALDRHGLSLTARVIDPVGYFDMIKLLGSASVVITDSGGVQKEAYFFRVPCVTVRDETEWVELVEHGCNVLAGADRQRLVAAVERMLATSVPDNLELYGGGNAAARIAADLVAAA